MLWSKIYITFAFVISMYYIFFTGLEWNVSFNICLYYWLASLFLYNMVDNLSFDLFTKNFDLIEIKKVSDNKNYFAEIFTYGLPFL